jgi:phosphoribosyl 1,2-cyclic phosphodiesterase
MTRKLVRGFCPLASGSKGNALLFKTQTTCILIDAGISTKTILEKLEQLQVDPSTLQAILVTHEHTDHIAGIPLLSERFQIPVLANGDTAKGLVHALGMRPRFKIFSTGETFAFGDLEIHPFTIPHDTLDPVAFTLRTGGLKVGICTDLGHVTSQVQKQLEKCDYLVLESNHEPSMVHACARPQVYKSRVLGKQGHLSNEACAELLKKIAHPKLKHVHLAHLSSECNAPLVALEKAAAALAGSKIEVSIAPQAEMGKAIHFEEGL